MILHICTVKDRAVDAFGRPFFITATGAAVRSFTDEVNNNDSEIAKHPDDYDLYHLGSFDDGTGMFDLCPIPELLIRGKDATSR